MERLETMLSGIVKQEQFWFEWLKEGQVSENLKILLDDFRIKSYSEIAKADSVHCQNNDEVRELEQKYEGLNMDQETKKIMDSLLSKKGELEFDIANNSYLAGIVDTYMMLKYLGFMKV